MPRSSGVNRSVWSSWDWAAESKKTAAQCHRNTSGCQTGRRDLPLEVKDNPLLRFYRQPKSESSGTSRWKQKRRPRRTSSLVNKLSRSLEVELAN